MPNRAATYRHRGNADLNCGGSGEIALYAKAQIIGVSKLTIATYNPKTGSYEASSDTVYGFSHNRHSTVLLFVGWRNNDFRPDEDTVTSK